MGRTYQVPRNVKGESRILFFFSVRSFLTTAGGILVGILFAIIFGAIGLGFIGIIMIALCALVRICTWSFNNTRYKNHGKV